MTDFAGQKRLAVIQCQGQLKEVLPRQLETRVGAEEKEASINEAKYRSPELCYHDEMNAEEGQSFYRSGAASCCD